MGGRCETDCSCLALAVDQHYRRVLDRSVDRYESLHVHLAGEDVIAPRSLIILDVRSTDVEE